MKADFKVVDAIWNQIITNLGDYPCCEIVLVAAFTTLGWTIDDALKEWNKLI